MDNPDSVLWSYCCQCLRIVHYWLPLWFVFVQCLVVLMLPVYPDCSLLIAPLVCLRSVSCGINVASVSGLSIIDYNLETLATLGQQDTERRQTKGAINNGQSGDTGNVRTTRYWTKTNQRGNQYWLSLWFVFVQCLVVLMLPVSPDCPLLIAPLVCLRSVSCGSNVASVSVLSIIDCPFGLSDTERRQTKGAINYGQSGDTGNIRTTRHWTKTNQKGNQ
jgi:hypothetical protein